jgi:hypothetical protein
MRTMHVGIVAALAFCIVVVDETEAQQYSAAGLAAGSYVSGRISGVAVGNQPVIVGGLLSVPVVTGTFTGEPIVSGGSGGQPVVSGEVLTAMSTTLVAPVVTTFPMQGEVMPYSYWVSAPKPARIYVEYGASDQFPFQGRAYGNPSARWSWYYMGGGDSRYLAKYYYPPLR